MHPKRGNILINPGLRERTLLVLDVFPADLQYYAEGTIMITCLDQGRVAHWSYEPDGWPSWTIL